MLPEGTHLQRYSSFVSRHASLASLRLSRQTRHALRDTLHEARFTGIMPMRAVKDGQATPRTGKNGRWRWKRAAGPAQPPHLSVVICEYRMRAVGAPLVTSITEGITLCYSSGVFDRPA